MTDIFKNQTTNTTTDDYDFLGGTLRVEIAGELDGADVTAYRRVSPTHVGAPVAWCSWRTTAQDVLSDADMGLERDLGVCRIFFEITNAGASTDISLSANVEE